MIMEYSVKSGSPEKQRTACVVVGVFESRKLSAAGDQIDQVSQNHLSNILRRGDLDGKLGQVLLLHHVPNLLCDRVLLLGCGKERDFNDAAYRRVIAQAITTLNETGSMEAVCFLSELNIKNRDIHWKVKQAVEVTEDCLYRFEQLKTKTKGTRRPLRKLIFNVSTRRELTIGEEAITEGEAVAAGMALAKDLANLPPNICTPTYLTKQAQSIADENKNVTCTLVNEKEMKALGMGAFMAVSQGSEQEGYLIVLKYQGAEDKDQKPTVLVGKGLTFDSGGISLKPGDGMDEMKFDMGGSASVFGAFLAAVQLKLPMNLIMVVAAAENMPSSRACRPGDVVTTMNGLTVEILNTDAEGRLVLCDALTYVERFNPDVVIDVATLTGACVVALGAHASGLLSSHNSLVTDLLNAGEQAGDKAWRLPLWEEYQEQLNSNFADMANIGGRAGGTITAACFLSRFTKKYHWAHLDIAGTAWKRGKEKGGTGRPVPLLTQYLLNRSKS